MLIALAADEIVRCEHAVLGPVDPQLGQYPAAAILKPAHQKPIAEVDDQTLILADQAEKAIAQMQVEVRELLAENYAAEKGEEPARLLTSGTWTHDYPITFERARELGLRVRGDMAEDMLHLMQLYPSRCGGSLQLSTCRCPSVQVARVNVLATERPASTPAFDPVTRCDASLPEFLHSARARWTSAAQTRGRGLDERLSGGSSAGMRGDGFDNLDVFLQRT